MPIWNPNETNAPYDDDDEIKDNVPKDLADFFTTHEIPRAFKITLKKFANENYIGRPNTLGEFEAVIPTLIGMVGMEGPGFFSLDCEYTDAKTEKRVVRNIKIPLVGEYWNRVWAEEKEKRKKEEVENAEHGANIIQAKTKGGAVNLVDPLAIGRQYMQDLKILGGGGGNDSMTMFMGMVQMMMKQSENTTQLLIAMMNNGQNKNSTQETLALLTSVLDVKEKLAPRDRNVIETFVEALADNADSILELFNKTPVEQSFDPAFQGVKKAAQPLADKAKVDPTFLKALVTHMDAKAGPEMTDKVLAGFINVKRPAAAKAVAAVAPAPAAAA